MSYETDKMESLTYALKNTDYLKYEIRKLNNNMHVLERLANAIERQNELVEIQLGLREIPIKPKIKTKDK